VEIPIYEFRIADEIGAANAQKAHSKPAAIA
jgi:hypothetical protein